MILHGGHAVNHNISGQQATANLVPFLFVVNLIESCHLSVREPVTVNVFLKPYKNVLALDIVSRGD